MTVERLRDNAEPSGAQEEQHEDLHILKDRMLPEGDTVEELPTEQAAPQITAARDQLNAFFSIEYACAGRIGLLNKGLAGFIVVDAVHHITVVGDGALIQLFKHGDVRDIVAVHESDIIARGIHQPGISRPSGPGVFFQVYEDNLIRKGAFAVQQNRKAAVSGCVVDQNQLKIPEGLMHQVSETGRERFFRIIDRDNDR